jgi:hypothetical protein
MVKPYLAPSSAEDETMIRKSGYRFSEMTMLEEREEENANAERSSLVHWRKRRTA